MTSREGLFVGGGAVVGRGAGGWWLGSRHTVGGRPVVRGAGAGRMRPVARGAGAGGVRPVARGAAMAVSVK
ncbi:hypothetical protein [Streptomyces tubercidicus]|uniref:hypothetical protein n=1 Tax=Streptomyces tubercidicus TaxID=47759 RepID=UPI0036BD1300